MGGCSRRGQSERVPESSNGDRGDPRPCCAIRTRGKRLPHEHRVDSKRIRLCGLSLLQEGQVLRRCTLPVLAHLDTKRAKKGEAEQEEYGPSARQGRPDSDLVPPRSRRKLAGSAS